MTPQSYATPLTSPNRPVRLEFDPVKLKSPMRSGEEKLGPPIYTNYQKVMADVDSVAFKYGIRRADIMGRERSRRYSWPRQEAYYLLHRKWGLSLPRTGTIMGRDHSTILHGVRQHEARNGLR